MRVAQELETFNKTSRCEARLLKKGQRFRAKGEWNTVLKVQPGFYGLWGPCYVHTEEGRSFVFGTKTELWVDDRLL